MAKSKEKNAFDMVLVIIIRVGVQLMTFDMKLVIIIRVGVQLMKKIYLLDLFLTESNYLKKLCVTDSVYVDNFSYILRLNSSWKVQD